MRNRHRPWWRRRALLPTALGFAAGAYAAYVAIAWARYGHAAAVSDEDERDLLLHRFMPACEVAERHHIHVAAPAHMTFDAARGLDLFHHPVMRMLVDARALILGAPRTARAPSGGLVRDALAIGWSLLADVPGREVVLGAVTKPWEPAVTFRTIPPDEFAAFDEPGYVKIAWTLRADPVGESESTFRTETRVATTDAVARSKFRRYWACFSPGIILIRWFALQPVRRAAERLAEGEAGRTKR